MKRLLLYVMGLFPVLFLFACANEVKDLQHTTDATGKLDAVVAIKETNATVATPTEVYVVPRGEKARKNPVFRADNVEGITLSWVGSTRLVIHADKARIFLHSKNIQVDIPNEHSATVEIELAIKDLR